MSTRRSHLVLSLVSLAACVGGAPVADRVYPLLPGGGTRQELMRVDIDPHRWGPPSLDFEVDCSALPYAKGAERDFCYQWGSWAVLHHELGLLVACSCGEFGGFVSWYDTDGTLLQTLLAGDIPQTLIADGDTLLCVTGITHLSISTGAIQPFRLVGDRWQAAAATQLAKQAETVAIEADGSLVFRLEFDAGALRYRAGVVEQLPPPARPDSTQLPVDRAIAQPRDRARGGAPARPRLDEVASLLGLGFGRLVTIDAEVLPEGGKGAGHNLRIIRIDGVPAPKGTHIRWTYGGWAAGRAEKAGRNGFTVTPGATYRLRGYEAGRVEGVPADVVDLLIDEWGPPQLRNMGFCHVFRVLDGELLSP